MRFPIIVVPFIAGLSCLGANSRELESTAATDTSGKMSPEDRELLKYCQKVQDISDRQERTDEKVDQILSHVENLKFKKSPVALDASKKEQLRSGWEEIETQKREAIEGLKDGDRDSGSGALPSGIVHSKE